MATSVLLLFLALIVGGFALIVAGTFVLLGPGWAMVAAGAGLLGSALWFNRGLSV